MIGPALSLAVFCAAEPLATQAGASAPAGVTSGPAPSASPPPAGPLRNAASLQLGSLGLTSVAVQVERFVLPPRVSLATGVGVRFMSAGDYRSTAIAVGEEARWWLRGRARLAMTGPYLGGRLDLTWTGVAERAGGRSVGDLVTLTETASFGWRYVIGGRVELTPALGLAMRSDLDPAAALAPHTRGDLRVALTAGWMF